MKYVLHTAEDDTDAAGAQTPDRWRYSEWSIVKRLVREHMAPHWRRISVAIGAMLIIAAMTFLGPLLIKQVVNDVLIAKKVDLLWVIAGATMVVFTIKALAMFVQARIMGFIGFRIVSDLQIILFDRVLRSDLSRLNDTHSGRFTASFLNDTQIIKRAVGGAVTDIFKNGTTAIALIAFVFWQDFMMAFVATVILPLIAFIIRKLGKRTRKAAKKGMAETGTMAMLISESLDGIRLVKAYGQEERETQRMADSVERRLTFQLKAIYSRAMASPVTELLSGWAIALVMLYGGYQVINERLDPGSLVAMLVAVGQAYQPLRSLANLHTVLAEGLGAAQRVFKVIDVKPQIMDAPDAAPLALSDGAVALDDVIFEYPDGTRALDGLTIAAPAGQHIALVGPSGAGKSTVLNLIPRFYDVSGGSVTVDGQDVRGVTMTSLRRQIAIVTQEPFLFDDTVRANIAYAIPDADEDTIIAAARDAAAHDFIMDLPNGYDTMVGEQGVKLSGGQRQRIAIARALVADAPILLLDEATSALDTESERQVQIALNRLMKGRTTIVIAHRLSTVIGADTIYVLDRGRVVEQGRHEDLLLRDGLYAKLYRTQLDEEPSGDPAAPLPFAEAAGDA